MKPSTPNPFGVNGKRRNITSFEKEFGAGRSSESKDVTHFNEMQDGVNIWNTFVASDGEKDQTGGDSTNAAAIPDPSCDPRSTQVSALNLKPIGSSHMTQEDCAALISPTTGQKRDKNERDLTEGTISYLNNIECSSKASGFTNFTS